MMAGSPFNPLLAGMTPGGGMNPLAPPRPPEPAPQAGQALPTPQELVAKADQASSEQRRLEEENSKLGTVALQVARGALDAVLAPGALLGAEFETVGSLLRVDPLEKLGRDIGEASSGKSAIEALGFVSEGGGREGLRKSEKAVQKVEDQEKAWPMLSAASRIAGNAALVLASGAGSATGGARAMLAAGAIEGAGGGAQAAYEEAAPLTDVLTSMMLGGAMGMAATGAGVAIGAGAKRLASKVTAEGAEALAPGLEKMAAKSAFKATIDRQTELNKVVAGLSPEAAEAKVIRIGQEILDSGSLEDAARWHGLRAPDELPQTLWVQKEEAGEALGRMRQELDIELGGEAAPDVKTLLQKIRAEVVDPLRKEATEGFTRTEATRDLRAVSRALVNVGERLNLAENVLDPATGAMVPRQIRIGSDKWWQAVDQIQDGQARIRFADLEAMRKNLADRVYVPPPKGGITPPPPRSMVTLQKIERKIASHIDDSAELALDRLGRDKSQYLKAKQKYSSLKTAYDGARVKANAILGNRNFSITDYGVGMGALASGGAGAIAALPMTLANKWLRENGRALTAVTLHRAARAMQGEVQHGVGLFAKSLGAAQTAVLAVPKYIPNVAREIGREAATEHERWRNREKALQRMVQSDQGITLAESLRQLPGIPAGLTTALSQLGGYRVQQLLTDLPKPRQDFRGPAYQRLSSTDVKLANAMYEAAFDPLSIFEDYKNGEVDYAKVKYVWKLYPGFQRYCQAAVVDMLSQQMDDDKRASIPDTALTQLDYFFGFAGELQPTLSTGFAQKFTALGAQQEADEQSQLKAPLKLPTTTRTMAQRMARM